MDPLERQVKELHSALQMLLYSEQRELEGSLAELTPAQRAFVRETLEQARTDDRLAHHESALLEHLFERWNIHGPALKLTLIARIRGLSDAGSWPDDLRSTCPAIDNILRVRASPASPQCEDVPA